MDRRVLILPASAAIIAALVIWRLDQEHVRRSTPRPVTIPKYVRPAPSFLLTTQSGGRAKLAAYLGRTKVVLFFTGGETPLPENRLFSAVTAAQPGIAGAGAQLVVVTPEPPQEVRKLQASLGSAFPFPVLSDIDPELGAPTPAHQIWGLRANADQPPKSGLFLIDRAGYTEFTPDREDAPGRPAPIKDVDSVIRTLEKGEWPL
jgi:peroxiredoxin